MNLAGFYEESISNGEGLRAVVFVSGCPHHCRGCHNEIAQDYDFGEYFDQKKQEEILTKIIENESLRGVTISGGEPLCPPNIKGVLSFLKELKKRKSSLDIWCYTGYTIEQLMEREDIYTKEILNIIDVLVDGKYVESLRNLSLKFRGSENQRIINLHAKIA